MNSMRKALRRDVAKRIAAGDCSPAGRMSALGGGLQGFEGGLGARQAALVGVHALRPAPERPPDILCRRPLWHAEYLQIHLTVRSVRGRTEPQRPPRAAAGRLCCSQSRQVEASILHLKPPKTIRRTCQQVAVGPARCRRQMRRSVASWASSCTPPGSLPAAEAAASARPYTPCSSRSSAATCAASAGVGAGALAALQHEGQQRSPMTDRIWRCTA